MLKCERRGNSYRYKVFSHTEKIFQEDGSLIEKKIYASFSSTDKEEAKVAALNFASNKKRMSQHKNWLLSEAYTKYIESKSSVLSPATVREYKNAAKRDLQGLMTLKLCELSNNTIQVEINKEAASRSPKTLRNISGLLSAVLGMFYPEFKLKVTLPEPKKTTIYVPTDADIQKLTHGIIGGKLEIPVLLAAFGSLRRSEVCALTPDDVDGNVISVNKAMVKDENKEWVVKGTKKKDSTRKIEMPEFVIKKLDLTLERIVPVSPDYITKMFSRKLEELGIPHFRFHDLRHYQASILHALGVPNKYIMARGGWRSEATLQRIYQHTMSDKEKEFTDIANNHFSSLYQEKDD